MKIGLRVLLGDHAAGGEAATVARGIDLEYDLFFGLPGAQEVGVQ
jgi:hypothetical protein